MASQTSTKPLVEVSDPSIAEAKSGDSVAFEVKYINSLSLAEGGISLVATGDASGEISAVESSSFVKTVTISKIAGNGTLAIEIAANSATGSRGKGNDAATSKPFKVRSDSTSESPITSTSTSSVSSTGSTVVKPTLNYVSMSPNALGSTLTPAITLTVSEASNVTLYSDASCSAPVSATSSLATGTGQTITANAIAANQTTTIYGKAVNSTAVASDCTSLVSYTNDNLGPTLTFSAVSAGNPGNILTPTILGTASETSTVTLYSDSNCTTSISSGTANTVLASPGVVLTSNVSGNTSTIIFGKAVDLAGNASICTNLVSYTHDGTAPTLTYTSISPSTPGLSQTPTVTFTLSESGDVQLYSDTGCSNTAISSVTALTAGTSRTITTSSLTANATINIYGKATDAVGNSSCTSLISYTHDNTAPTLSSITLTTSNPGTSSTASVSFSLNERADVGLYDSNTCTNLFSSLSSKNSGSNTMTTNTINVGSSVDIYIKAADSLNNATACVGVTTYTRNGNVADPVADIAAGAYGPAQSVTLSSSTSTAIVYYTTDGSDPTCSSSTGSISVTSSMTVKAIGCKNTFANSNIVTFSYVINGQVATPTVDVVGGSYGPTQSVSLSSATSGASIYYTVDGSTPSASSTLYSSSISVSGSLTLKAIAINANYTNSNIMSESYTINGAVSSPTFSVTAGTYNSTQTVGLSSATSGASIRYTTDGSTPTTSSGTIYASTISVSSSMTIKAIAYKAGWDNSSVASATYVYDNTAPLDPSLNPATQTFSSNFVVTASQNATTDANFKEFRYTTTGTAPTSCANGTATSGSISITGTSNVTLKVVACDYAGNMSSSSATGTYTYDVNAAVIVANVTSAESLGSSSQRKSFFDTANSKHWVFYYSSSQIKYAYSSDNSTWTEAGTLSYNTSGFAVSYKTIGSVPYVFVTVEANSYDIVLIRGQISATAISFDGAQTVFDGTSSTDYFVKPVVATDTNDKLWVAAVHSNSTTNAVAFQPMARRSTNIGNGDLSVWSSTNSVGIRTAAVTDVAILPRTGNQMYFLVNAASQLIGYNFDGTNWSAANAGGVDSWFTFPSAGLDGSVAAIAIVGTDVYVGGGFLNIGGNRRLAYIAKWNGSTWSHLGGGLNGAVTSMVASGTDVYVGGNFTTVEGKAVAYIAKWNGVAWSALGTGLNNSVDALAASGSDIYVAGSFTSAGGSSSIRSVAKWNGTTWSALGSSSSISGLQTIAVSGSDVYIGGSFTTVRTVSASKIAKWNGSAWSALGTGVNSTVYAIAVSGSNVYAGGNFSTAGGNSAAKIAKWDGSTWSALGSGLGSNYPRAILISGSDVYVVGSPTAGGVTVNSIGKWNGTAWSPVGSGVGSSASCIAMSGSDIYVGGWFTTLGSGVAASSLAKWNGTTWTGFGTAGINGIVYAIALSGTDVYIGGAFTDVYGVAANRIAKWDGSTWSSIGTGITSGTVYSIAVYGGNIYVGGNFSITLSGGVYAYTIAKWNGSSWGYVGTESPLGANKTVYAMLVSGGLLYVAGDFTGSSASSNSGYVARWNGSAWLPLGTTDYPNYLDGPVYALAASGSDIYAGGAFYTANNWVAGNLNSFVANSIAKWNGTGWSALGSGIIGGSAYSTASAVLSLAVSGTDLYAGGAFTTDSGMAFSANRIAKWNGSTWSSLGTGLNGTVRAVAVSGTDVYVGGDFTTAGGSTANAVAKWNGTSWSTLGTGVNVGGYIYTLSTSGSNIYFGGLFTTVDSYSSRNLTIYQQSSALRVGAACCIGAVSSESSGDIHLLASGSSQIEYYKYSGSSWSAATNLAAITANTSVSLSFDDATSSLWALWIDGGLLKYMSYATGAWGSATSLTTSSVVPSGFVSDFNKTGSVVDVFINDVSQTQKTVVIKTLP